MLGCVVLIFRQIAEFWVLFFNSDPVAMSSSSSQSYGSSFNWNWPRPEIVNCNHDLKAELVTSRTAANPGRRYYRCPIWKEDDCRFFRWSDAGLSPSQDTYFQRIKVE